MQPLVETLRNDQRALLDRYERGENGAMSDARQVCIDLLATVFSRDAEVDFSDVGDWYLAGKPVRSSGFVRSTDFYAAIVPDVYGALHFMTNHLIEVESERGFARSYMHGLGDSISALYLDETTRESAGWRTVKWCYVVHMPERPTTPFWYVGNTLVVVGPL